MNENEFLSESDLSKDVLRIINTDCGVELRLKFEGDKKEKAFFISKDDLERLKKILSK